MWWVAIILTRLLLKGKSESINKTLIISLMIGPLAVCTHRCKHSSYLLLQWHIWPSFSCLSPLVASAWPLHLPQAPQKSSMQWYVSCGLKVRKLLDEYQHSMETCFATAECIWMDSHVQKLNMCHLNIQGTHPYSLLKETLNKSVL